MAEFAFAGTETVSSVLPGYTRNPYDTRYVSAGSSGGTAAAIAANFATVGLGTDTGASIRGPSSHQSLVGIRATMGLVSRDGVIPLSSARDVLGPMARSVDDAVRVLEVLAGYDPSDPVTAASRGKVPDSYTQYLDPDGLKDARLGVACSHRGTPISRDGVIPLSSARDVLGPMARSVDDAVRVLEVLAGYDPSDPVTAASRGKVPDSYTQYLDPDGLKDARLGVARHLFAPGDADPEVLRVMEEALAELRSLGATLIDPVRIEGLQEIRDSFRRRAGSLKYDFNRYLESLGPHAPYQTLEDIVESKKFHPHNEKRLRDALAVEEPPEEQSQVPAQPGSGKASARG